MRCMLSARHCMRSGDRQTDEQKDRQTDRETKDEDHRPQNPDTNTRWHEGKSLMAKYVSRTVPYKAWHEHIAKQNIVNKLKF